MKREIKFRVYAGYRMEYFGLGDTVPYYYPDENSAAVKYEPVMQYTGLKDKNGKEIYEGDILIGSMKLSEPFFIEWLNEEGRYTNFFPREDFKIIGNIYENPDLLK